MLVKPKSISEQVIVIIGASSGIGLATARMAGERGAKLVITARSSAMIEQLATELRQAGYPAMALPADAADRQQLLEVAEAAVARFDRIDTWINNAGVAIYGRLDEVSDQDNRRLFDTNFWGVVNGSLVAIPYLRQQGGALINVGSEVSEVALPLLGMYTASKHAVKAFTDSLRIELEQIDQPSISVTLVQPTAVDTPCDEPDRDDLDRQPDLPAPMIDPEDVARAILEAAEKPIRRTRLGMISEVSAFEARNLPGVAETIAAK